MKVTPSGLIIPSSVADREPPVFFCAVCKEGFGKSKAADYQRHVVACAERHEDDLRAMSPRAKAPGIFGDEGWDVEFEQWVRDNKRGIIDGKVKM